MPIKGKDKKWENWLALKVLIRFKIELVYSIWKPVIWKFNFSNSLNVQRSSPNVKSDNYKDKRNPLFTFNVIKLVLFWHKFITRFIFSSFENACYVRCQVFSYDYSEWLFSFIFLTHRATKLSQRGHKNRHFKHMYFNFVFCEIGFLKKLFWNRPLKIVALFSQKHKILWLPVPYTTHLQYCKT